MHVILFVLHMINVIHVILVTRDIILLQCIIKYKNYDKTITKDKYKDIILVSVLYLVRYRPSYQWQCLLFVTFLVVLRGNFLLWQILRVTSFFCASRDFCGSYLGVRGVQRECYTLICHKIKTVHYINFICFISKF